jgi:oxygen-dependent protoporphyrinogen oxidase
VTRIAVVGGGIAGLATALAIADRARRAGTAIELAVVEAAPRVGGNLRTESDGGYTVEWGPNGFLDNVPATLELVERLGLRAELQPADASAAKRFLYRGGRLHELPLSPLAFLGCPVLSVGGRLRVLGEPWTRPKPAGLDETVDAFATRHIGAEAARVLVGAMVSGVFAGDSRRLSLASAFPKMAEMEAAHGSLVRAMIAKGRERRRAKRRLAELATRGEDAPELRRPGGPAGPGGTLTSFRQGIETFGTALAAALRAPVATGRPVTRLVPAPLGTSARWRIEAAGGPPIEADQVVLAVPAGAASALTAPFDPGLAATLAEIPTAPLAVVALGFDQAALGRAPHGFGFLAPRGEGLRILGCLWDSSIFPGRAPAGKVLLRAMIGGATDPAAIALSEAELVAAVRADLGRAMGIRVDPERVWVFRHRQGISQYVVGHGERLASIEHALAGWPGLHVAGQSYRGVAMNACVEEAGRLAARVLAGAGREAAAPAVR